MTPAPAVAVDPAQAHLVQELKHPSPLLGCRFDPSGEFIFAGAQDNAVVRWHLPDGKKTVLAGHKSWVRALAFAVKDKLLFSASYDGKVLAWPLEAETPAPVRTLEAHKGWVRALAVSPDGRTLASCGNDQLVKLWSVSDGNPVRELSGHASHVYNVAFHPGGRFLASADLKGVVKVWDLEKGTQERELDASALYRYDPSFMADHGGVRGMTFRADGAALACCGITDVTNAFAGIGKPLVLVFDWTTGKAKQLRPKENFQGTAWGVCFHPAGFTVAVGGGNGGALWFWKGDGAQDVFALKFPINGRDLALHPDGRRLAVACADGAVRVYDMGPKKEPAPPAKPAAK
jgi:WD40 repeat protein